MTKILFTDLDGTLLNDASEISAYSKDVLIRMVEAGHKLVFSSGRHQASVMDVVKAADIDIPGLYITANNGSVVYDCATHKNICEYRVSREMTDILWKMSIEYGVHIQTYDDTGIISCAEDEALEVYTSRIHMPVKVTEKPVELLDNPPFKLLGIELHDHAKIRRLCDDINAMYGDEVQAVFSQVNYLERFNRKAGKGTGRVWLCDHLGIPVADSYAAGDAMNDMSMLKAAGHGVAMKNADPAIFEAAEFITEFTNDEDGLARFIEKEIIGYNA